MLLEKLFSISKLNSISNIHVVIVSLIPVFLVTGPFLSDLAIVLSSLIFFYQVYRFKLFKHFKNLFFIFIILISAYLIINSLFSKYPINSLSSTLFYIRFGIFALSVKFLLDTNNNFLLIFFYILLLTLLVLVFDTYFQYFVGFNILGFENKFDNTIAFGIGEQRRISGLLRNELKLGSLISRLMPIFLALYLFLYKKRDINISIILILLFLVFSNIAIIMIGERSAVFYIFFITLTFIFFGNINFKIISIFVSSLMILIFVVLFFDKSISNRMVDLTLSQMNLKEDEVLSEKMWSGFDDLNFNIFSPHHTAHYVSAYKMFLSNPLFGVGPKNFRILCKNNQFYVKYACSTHPHNTYVQLLAETGLLIPLVFIIIFILINYILIKQFFLLFFKQKYVDSHLALLYSSLFISLFPLIPTGSVFNNWLSIIYYLPIGFILYFNNEKNKIR